MVCPSVTLVHPAKAVGWNEIPFGRDTPVVTSNTIRLAQVPRGREHLGVGGPEAKVALQIAARLLQIAEWLL